MKNPAVFRGGGQTSSRVVKRLLSIDPQTLESNELARFWMDGDELRVEWKSWRWKEEMEAHGIAVAKGQFFPKDGKPFFDNLELAFSNSTYMDVVS